MESIKIRKSFLDFFNKKNHRIIESSSLVPADPTVLFTSAGMQQFIPYLSGKTKPPFQRAASVQKCFRTSDIDSVGDESHHTFFEMLGNWSFGEYWKEEAIKWALELLNSKFQIPNSKLWVTVFKGENGIARDEETIEIWQKNGIARERIKEFGLKDNFWGPIGDSGPCGPCSEIHYDQGEEHRKTNCTIKGCGPNCGCGRFIEIWNLVFMEYNKTADGQYEKLPKKNIDTGAGLERIASVLQRTKSNFETDLFLPLIKKIEQISSLPYLGNEKAYRLIADHVRAACFLIADGILPSKEDRGYVLRRILRRAIRYGNFLKIRKGFLPELAKIVIDQYKEIYPELGRSKNDILTIIQNEEEKFEKTLKRGLKEFEKAASYLLKEEGKKLLPEDDSKILLKQQIFPTEKAFELITTYGFPLELIKEIAKEKGFEVDEIGLEKAFKKHQEISRAGAQKKFGGGGELSPKLHTATHLLHAALRQVLGNHVQQAGSDINPERLRFDFTHPQKMTAEEIKKVEEIVNEKIKERLSVKVEEMSYEEAIKSGALAFFKERYPERVKVYSIGDFSKEICAGPHVNNTAELGQFRIIKEESSGVGVRRIKAVLT